MAPSRRERRNRERRSCSLYLRFLNYRTGELIGSLADISAEGFRLESTRPIPLQVDFIFRIDVPREISARPYIKVMARSRWGKPDMVDPRLYQTGFEIVGIDASDVQAMARIIERYGSSATGVDSSISYMWGR
jgi:hypothetical protein